MSANHASTTLAPIAIPGTDATIMATVIDGAPMVALKPMCEAIGIAYSAQLTKLKGKSWAVVSMNDTTGSDGKTYQMAMIDRRTMTMWLATIDENRVSAEAKPTVVAFQAEAADALDAYFHTGQAINPRGKLSTFDILRAQIDQIEAAQRTADAAMAIASTTESRLDAIEGRHDWFSALGYAIEYGHNTNSQFLAKIGRHATAIAKEHGIEPVKVQHAHYGKVNSYPKWIWDMVMEGRDGK